MQKQLLIILVLLSFIAPKAYADNILLKGNQLIKGITVIEEQDDKLYFEANSQYYEIRKSQLGEITLEIPPFESEVDLSKLKHRQYFGIRIVPEEDIMMLFDEEDESASDIEPQLNVSTFLKKSVPESNKETLSYHRLKGMAGITMAIENTATDVNLANLGNPAGLAVLPKRNELTIQGAYYTANADLSNDWKRDITGWGLDTPGATNQNVMVWPMENFVVAVNIGYEQMDYLYDEVDDTPDKFNWKGSTLEILAAYHYKRLIIGAQLSNSEYTGEMGDYFRGYETLEIIARHQQWTVGLGYVMESMNKNFYGTIGLSIGNGNKKPDLLTVTENQLWEVFTNYHNYEIIYKSLWENQVWYQKDDSHEKIESLYINTELTLHYQDSFSIGLLLSNQNETQYRKRDFLLTENGYYRLVSNYDFKRGANMDFVFTPLIKGKLDVDDTIQLTYGVMYSNEGSTQRDTYSLKFTSDPDGELYKMGEESRQQDYYSIGIGMQSSDKKYSIGVQFDQQRCMMSETGYNIYDEKTSYSVNESKMQAVRIGAEVSILPIWKMQAGYSYITTTEARYVTDLPIDYEIHHYAAGTTITITPTIATQLTVLLYDTKKLDDTGVNKYEQRQLTGEVGVSWLF